MDNTLFRMLAVICVIFGLIGGIMAFINAYDGYSHFPAISRSKKIRMSIEIAVGAFFMAVTAVAFVFFILK